MLLIVWLWNFALSRLQRPQWDVVTLLELGVRGVEVEAQEWIASDKKKRKSALLHFFYALQNRLFGGNL